SASTSPKLNLEGGESKHYPAKVYGDKNKWQEVLNMSKSNTDEADEAEQGPSTSNMDLNGDDDDTGSSDNDIGRFVDKTLLPNPLTKKKNWWLPYMKSNKGGVRNRRPTSIQGKGKTGGINLPTSRFRQPMKSLHSVKSVRTRVSKQTINERKRPLNKEEDPNPITVGLSKAGKVIREPKEKKVRQKGPRKDIINVSKNSSNLT